MLKGATSLTRWAQKTASLPDGQGKWLIKWVQSQEGKLIMTVTVWSTLASVARSRIWLKLRELPMGALQNVQQREASLNGQTAARVNLLT